MRARLAAALERIDALSLRERALGFVVAMAVAYAAWDNLLMTPLAAHHAATRASIDDLREEAASLDRHVRELAVLSTRDPDVANRARLQVLRKESAAVDVALAELTGRLVPPREMAPLLEAVLSRRSELVLHRLEGLGADSLTDAAAGVAGGEVQGAGTELLAGVSPVYRHGLKVAFAGGYLDTIAYLHELESLPWRFLWSGIAFEVGRYPDAEVTITVYSLSLDEAWIGV